VIDSFCAVAPGAAHYYKSDSEEEKRWKDTYNVAWEFCEIA